MRARSLLRSARRLLPGGGALPLLLGVLGVSGASVSACSLSDIKHADCASDDECSKAFGLGSACQAGYCSDGLACTTGHDCRKKLGGGVCVEGLCSATIPKDSACQALFDPDDLFTTPAGPGAPLIIGAIFSTEESKNEAITKAVRLAVREIDRSGALTDGQKLAVVVCDNGGPMNAAAGDARIPLNNHAIDYLSGTLGAPVVIGPLTSSDSIRLINRIKEKSYPTVLISPSATSPQLTAIDDRLNPNDTGLFWRTAPSDLLQGKVLADNVVDKAAAKVAVTYIQDAYGEGLATVFQTTFGSDKVKLHPYTDDDLKAPAKLDALASAIDADAPNAVVVIALHGATLIQLLTPLATKTVGTNGTPFYFTDGSKDATALLAPSVPPGVQAILAAARGTAPASPSGSNYDLFKTNLLTEFSLDAGSFSFLAQAYDATYVGAYGIILAAKNGPNYDGVQVAAALTHLSKGTLTNVAPTTWQTAKGELIDLGQFNVEGTSGHLDFDPKTGEAPAPIEVWGVAPDKMSFVTLQTIDP
jgi:branched-chain amino acid transport system substrate-binding protein